MRTIQSFDPSLTTGVIDTLGVNVNEQLELYNESIYGLKLTFQDNSIAIIPPAWNKTFIMKNVPMGKVSWEQYVILTGVTAYPVNLCYGIIYEADEHVTDVDSPMTRGMTVTNPGSISVGTVSTLVNRANAANTQVINLSSALNASDTVIVTNDGQWSLYTTIGGVLVPFLKSNTTDPILQLGAATKQVEILGNQKVDGTFQAVGATTLNSTLGVTGALTASSTLGVTGALTASSTLGVTGALTASSTLAVTGASTFTGAIAANADPAFSTPPSIDTINEGTGVSSWASVTGIGGTMNTRIQSGNIINFQIPGGTSIADIETSGLRFQPGKKVLWENGNDTLRQTHTFTASASGTFNHGCAASPFYVNAVSHTASSTTTTGYDSETSTQVHLTIFSSMSCSVLCMVG